MLLVAILTGCESDANINRVYPDLVVVPGELAFGDVAVHYSSSTELQVVNGGLADLEVTELTLSGESGDVFSAAPAVGGLPLVLAKDEAAVLNVGFLPETYLTYTGTLTLHSNDEEFPQKEIALSGTGVDAPGPDIEPSALSLDFGTVSVGSTGMLPLVIANAGGGPLNVGTLEQTGSGGFAVRSGDISGYTIPAGQSQTVLLAYVPTHDMGDAGALRIPSDDPDEPEVVVQLLGNGGGDFDYPVAVAECPASTTPRTTISMDGTASYDPEGYEPLTHQWSLVSAPDGSAAAQDPDEALLSSSEPIAYLTTDLAGDYVVSLQVANTIGLTSVPDVCTIPAIPEEQLHVELTWDTDGADLDLHLVQEGGEYYVKPGDCTYCNPSPDWGAAGDANNPSLDLDDRYGYGPENINLADPADGDYTIYVHYFEDNGDATDRKSVV